MKILIADAFPDESIEQIKGLGCEVIYNSDLGADDLPANIKGIDVLVVRSTKVTAATVETSDNLALVIRAGSGVNTIDLEACAGKGIFVSNCPGLNAVAVAELTMAHILCLDRNIPDCVIDLRNGTWNKGKYAKLANGLKGRFMGIIGFGNIGREVAKRANAFDMKVMAFDPVQSKPFVENHGASYCDTLEKLFAKADVISVHVPLNDKTRNLINADAFDLMKPGTFIVNASRGGVIDEEAFLAAAESKGIRGGFDVFADEPGAKSCDYVSKTAQSPAVYGTHHIGASTVQAQLAVADEVIELLRAFAAGGHVKNCVNMESASRAKAVLVIRHYDRVGVLAEIFRILKEEKINVEDMENIILQGQETACARIKVNTPLGDLSKLTDDEVVKDDIIHVEMYNI